MTLTPRQRQILDFIHQSFRQHGHAPTTREICQHFGFSSPATVTSHLRLLEKKGALSRIPGHQRTIRLPNPPPHPPRLLEIPLLGSIPAGTPLDQHEQRDRFLTVDADTLQIPVNARTFALRVCGDSMTGAGILDGDIVILEHGLPARPGDIVAAAIDGEVTLKRLILKNGQPCLRAENPRYPDLIPAHDLVIEGVFRALLRIAKRRSPSHPTTPPSHSVPPP